jgi:periplasmic divalent cation tolerance protein
MNQNVDVVVVILSTAPDAATGESMARTLVDEGLAACVTRTPGCRSVYRWEGSVESVDEELLLIKTHARRAQALTRRLQELHPYEVPEILVLPAAAGLTAYLDWVRNVTLAGEPT